MNQQPLQASSGPGTATAVNLPTFQADVGEGRPRVFRAKIGQTPDQDVLFTDIEEVNAQGGHDQQVELRVTVQNTDEFSQRCWAMTMAQRNQLRARIAADANGGSPNGQPNITVVEDVVQAEVPADHPAESKPVLGSEANPLQTPYVATPPDPPPDAPRMMTEEDLIASVLITNQQSAIDDLSEIIAQYVEDEKIKRMAERIYQRIEGFYQKYGIPNPFETTTDEV